jgi:hypothetical protein
MAGCHPVREAGLGDQVGQLREVQHPRVEGLVGVQVDRTAELRRQREHKSVVSDRVGIQVGAAPDHICAHLHRRTQQRPQLVALGPGQPHVQGDELEIYQVA